MAGTNHTPLLLTCFVLLFFFCRPAAAFGAGNIPSIARIEGGNFRHGDIEDVILGMAFLKGKKWTPQLLKRVYFGNWLRDYSQAIDVGTLKGVNAGTIRVLVWVLSFMSFGYATGEFEVTAERLGCYRPEEHIGKFTSLCTRWEEHKGNTNCCKITPRTTQTTLMLACTMSVSVRPSTRKNLQWIPILA